MALKKLVQCPACRFTNRAGDPRCLVCKAVLPENAPEAAPPTQPAPPPGVRQRLINSDGVDIGPRVAPGPLARKGPPKAAPKPAPPAKKPAPAASDAPPRETAPIRRPKPDLVGSATEEALATDEVKIDAASSDEGTSELARGTSKATPTTRIVAANIDRSKIVGWLVCDPLPPIPLGGKPLLTIGRHHECDLVLPHKEISRRHAVVKVRGANIVFEDEGSSNGSFVNGQRVSHSLLRVGDTIAIGPYEVEIRSSEDMSTEDDKSATRTNLELTSVSRLNPLAAMTGKIQEVPLAEVLQGIEFNKKSGTLTVVSERQQGALVVSGGAPVFARWGDLADDQAVLRMLTLVKGRFAFAGEQQPGERTMRSSLTGLLLEASRMIDEGETAPADKGADALGEFDGEVTEDPDATSGPPI